MYGRNLLHRKSVFVNEICNPIEKVVPDFAVTFNDRLSSRFRVEWKQFRADHSEKFTNHMLQGTAQNNHELCFEPTLKGQGTLLLL